MSNPDRPGLHFQYRGTSSSPKHSKDALQVATSPELREVHQMISTASTLSGPALQKMLHAADTLLGVPDRVAIHMVGSTAKPPREKVKPK